MPKWQRAGALALLVVSALCLLVYVALEPPSAAASTNRIDVVRPDPDRPLIVDWTGSFYGRPLIDNWDTASKTCKIGHCQVSGDRSLASQASAVLFHLSHIDWRSLPPVRHSHQLYVFVTMESPTGFLYGSRLPWSPGHPRQLRRYGRHFFNVTMSYSWQSDIPTPYGTAYVRREKPVPEPPALNSIVANKTRAVAWFVSKCYTDSRREAYASQLGRHIQVDVYGGCGRLQCTNCDRMLRHDYHFYLAFENSVCDYYVTEKVVRCYEQFVVPVVLSARVARQAGLPDGSFIAADEFSSPKHLADHLKLLMANTTLYKRYFDFHRTHQGGLPADVQARTGGWCRLCELLHQSNSNSSSRQYIVPDIAQTFYDNACRRDFAYRLLPEREQYLVVVNAGVCALALGLAVRLGCVGWLRTRLGRGRTTLQCQYQRLASADEPASTVRAALCLASAAATSVTAVAVFSYGLFLLIYSGAAADYLLRISDFVLS